jgi:hypothetical protein
MSETVFILGAGVSHQAGAPLMKDFIDAADDLRKGAFHGDADFDLVFKGLRALQSVYAKATIEVLNIESVFAAFEMAQLLGGLASLTAAELQRLPRAMSTMIQRTLETRIRFPITEGSPRPQYNFEHLGNIVSEILKRTNNDFTKISFITFNYDVCLEFGLYTKGIASDYCLDPTCAVLGIKVLKLHGSLNWARCDKCSKIHAFPVGKFVSMRSPVDWIDAGKSTTFEISRELQRLTCCEQSVSATPLIAPPTWNKTSYHRQLETVWKASASVLSDAENIFICGYSMPPTDQFFPYLYALGSVGTSRIRRFWIVNPDTHVRERFLELCGPEARVRFEHKPHVLENVIYNEIRPALVP